MALWTPAEITTSLWLDAADASTFTLTGASVNQWADKSGNSRHAAPAVAAKPTLTANALNSLSGVSFASTGNALITPSFDNPSGSDGLSLFAVLKRTGIPVGSSNIFTKGLVNAQWSLYWTGSDFSSFSNISATGNTASFSGVSSNVNVVFSGVMSDAAIHQYFNGLLMSGSAGAATRSFGAASALTIGSSPTSTYSTNRFQGLLFEAVLIHGDLTTDTRQKVEGYLAWKWGLQGNLDASHPFYSSAPELEAYAGIIEPPLEQLSGAGTSLASLGAGVVAPLLENISGQGTSQLIFSGVVEPKRDEVFGAGQVSVVGWGLYAPRRERIGARGFTGEEQAAGAITPRVESVSATGRTPIVGWGRIVERIAMSSGQGASVLPSFGTGRIADALPVLSGHGSAESVGSMSIVDKLPHLQAVGRIVITGAGKVAPQKSIISGSGNRAIVSNILQFYRAQAVKPTSPAPSITPISFQR